jgi:ketosteroid isomerase-like protein
MLMNSMTSKAMESIVADDFTITFSEGSMQTKAQLMDSIKVPRKPGSTQKFWTEDVRARVYGDTVVLTGRVVSEFPRGDKLVREESRYTDTYAKRNGRWQVVASHLSDNKPPKTSP